MSQHSLSLLEFIERVRGQELQLWQLGVLAALENTTHEEDPMTIDTDRGHPSNRTEQASCPPEFHTHSCHGELKSALDCTTAAAATPLAAASGALDCAIDELSHQIHQLEDRLQDVLTPDSEVCGDFPQPPAPKCSNAVIRIHDQEDRINVLRRKVVDLLNRLEC